MLESKRTGAQFANEQYPLALFTYQTLSQADYDRFLKSYITVQTDWAPKDFGKPNIGRYGAESRKWHGGSEGGSIKRSDLRQISVCRSF